MKPIKQLKIWIKIQLKLLADVYTGHAFTFAGKNTNKFLLLHSIELVQEIKQTETAAAKLFNIKTAAEKINPYILLPNEIFSFWKIAGNPNIGFQKSRSIVNGEILNESGGGICQVAGSIYHVSIIAGLEILERHNHSIDLYTEETRFAPLGTDAAVVYGHKDLRIRNCFSFPIKFFFEITSDRLCIQLLSTEPIHEKKITFTIHHNKEKTIVEVCDNNNKKINTSTYKKLI
ncbi:MAG TPA: VanW family protein [Cytophaga sp.]|jgi:vancomycin resistance protein VanW|nr:VanW family protein [Cytophaga sp.]